MALQLRRGTNAQRLGMTPANGELIFVTDYELVSTSVTGIDAGTDTLTTTAAHGLSVDQQVKYIGDTLNGLTEDQVYFVKTVPTITTFTLSTTQGGSTLNITPSFTVDLVFAKTPTLASGAPVGLGVSPLWIGDGDTVGGVIAGSLNLDDLLDVQIGGAGGVSLANYQHLQYDASSELWRNVNDVVVPGDLSVNGGNININGTATAATMPFLTFSTQADGANPLYGIRGMSSADDPWFVGSGSTGDDLGYLEIATGDNALTPGFGGEIYVRQYSGSGAGGAPWYGGSGSIINSLTLLNDVGDTAIPNNVTISGATDTTSQSTGALKVAGGVGIIKSLHIGGTFSVDNGNNATSTTSGSIQTDGGIGVVADIFVGGQATITGDLAVNGGDLTTTQTTFNLVNATATTVNIAGAGTTVAIGVSGAGEVDIRPTTDSSSQTTGALQVAGGVGIVKNLHVGGTVSVDNGNDTTNPTTGSIQTDGGVGIVKSLHVGGVISVDNGNNATSATTGSIQTDGGVGIVKDLFVGGSTTITGDLTVQGTTTTINSTTLLVKDKNIEMGVVTTPTDVTADGGGIILKGTTDKTILYDNALGVWVSNIDFNTTGSTLGNVTVGVVDNNTISTTTGDLDITATGNNGVNITSGSDAPTLITRNTAGTNDIVRSLTLSVQSSGTPAVGIGNSLEYEIETAVGNTERAGFISVVSTDVTPASEDFSMNFGLMTAGATASPVMVLNNAGDLQIDGDLTVSGATDSSSSTTGAVKVAGGVGIVKKLHVGGTVSVDDTTNATSTFTGSIQTDGGIGVVSDIFVGGNATIVGDIAVNGGDLTTTQTTFNLVNTTATTLNIGGAATAVNIGASTGSTIINADLNVNGTTLTLDANNAGAGNDISIVANRGSSGTDASLTWTESSDFWVFSNDVFAAGLIAAGTSLATNGNDIFFNNEDGAAADAFITVRRPSVGDAIVKWNETTDRWQTSVDDSTYLNIPNQNLDATDSVSFSDVTVDGIATFNSQTTTTTALTTVTVASTAKLTLKAIINVIDNVTGEMQVLEALAFRKGTAGYLTTYAEMYTNAALATFTVIGTGGLTSIQATPLSTNSTTFTVARISLD